MLPKSKKKKSASVEMDPRRARALDQALMMSRLLESDYFAEAMKAVDDGSKEKFVSVCKKAKIPDPLPAALWAYAQSSGDDYLGLW